MRLILSHERRIRVGYAVPVAEVTLPLHAVVIPADVAASSVCRHEWVRGAGRSRTYDTYAFVTVQAVGDSETVWSRVERRLAGRPPLSGPPKRVCHRGPWIGSCVSTVTGPSTTGGGSC